MIAEARITVCGHVMRFNTEATRWLRVYFDIGLQFRAYKNLTLEKARRAEDRVRRLATMKGMTPELVRRIQVTTLQAVAQYGAEIWWNDQKDCCEEYQKLINRHDTVVRRIFQTAPTGIVTRQARLRPTLYLLNNGKRRYRHRLLAAPVTQSICDILTVTLRECHKQAQLGD